MEFTPRFVAADYVDLIDDSQPESKPAAAAPAKPAASGGQGLIALSSVHVSFYLDVCHVPGSLLARCSLTDSGSGDSQEKGSEEKKKKGR